MLRSAREEKTSEEKAMAKLESLQKNIDALRTAIPELRGVLIASIEGLPVAHSIAGSPDQGAVRASR
jgi:predicted regulator of Ras-like GTPase activity (Roadblock/LC7/MglB family)